MSSVASDEIQSVFDLVNELRTLIVRLDGTDAQAGVLRGIAEASESLEYLRTWVSEIADRLQSASALSNQIKALPGQLLQPHESAEFRASMQKALHEDAAQILRVSYETALKGACLEAVEKAVAEIQVRIDTTALERSLVAEEASKVLQGKLADHLTAARKWSLTRVVTGAILGAVLSNLYLAPQIEALLTPETTHKPIYQGR